MPQPHIIFGRSYLLTKQGKNRLELDLILVMRTKGQTTGKHISINVNIFSAHGTGYLEQVLMTATGKTMNKRLQIYIEG